MQFRGCRTLLEQLRCPAVKTNPMCESLVSFNLHMASFCTIQTHGKKAFITLALQSFIHHSFSKSLSFRTKLKPRENRRIENNSTTTMDVLTTNHITTKLTDPNHEQTHKYHHLTTTLHLTVKMTTAQVVETSATNNNL